MPDRKYLTFTNPATGEDFGQVPAATDDEVQLAMSDMRSAFKIWSLTPVKQRVRILRKFQTVMLDSLDEITDVISRDTGKSRQDALIEVFITANVFSVYLKNAARWLRRRKVSRGWYFFKSPSVEPSPFGVTAVISPWNYPFALAVPPVFCALLAGNTVLLKPSEVAAASGAMIEKLFQQVPELSPYLRVLHGDGDVGSAIVRNRPDFIFLTGSPATGKKVMQAAAEYLIPTALELGGKDAMIVLADADLDAAARWGVWGACFNTGQTCMSVERVYVVEAVYDEFIKRAQHHMAQLKMGYTPDIDSPYYLGPISDPRQLRIILEHLKDAAQKGARVLAGGGNHGMYIEPALLVDVTHNMAVMQVETFGPILPVIRVKDEAEAVSMANDSTYGLGASIWSRDVSHALDLARQIEAGSVIINDTIAQFAFSMLPFGGVKQSGIGRIHGQEGLLIFTQAKAYVTGQPPHKFDIATIMRNPGNYSTGADLMRLLFGATWRQRLQPAAERLGLRKRASRRASR